MSVFLDHYIRVVKKEGRDCSSGPQGPRTCTNFMATSLKPFCSNLLMMSPMRPRCTPSGLIMMKVRSSLPILVFWLLEEEDAAMDLRRCLLPRMRWRSAKRVASIKKLDTRSDKKRLCSGGKNATIDPFTDGGTDRCFSRKSLNISHKSGKYCQLFSGDKSSWFPTTMPGSEVDSSSRRDAAVDLQSRLLPRLTRLCSALMGKAAKEAWQLAVQGRERQVIKTGLTDAT